MEGIEALMLLESAILMGGIITYARALICTGEMPLTWKMVWKKHLTWFMTALWFMAALFIWFVSGNSVDVLRWVYMIFIYVLLAVIDVKKKIVPDYITGRFLLGELFLGGIAMEIDELMCNLIYGILFMMVLLLVTHMLKGNMGLGDAKLLGVTAMVAGVGYTILIFMLGLFISAIYGMWLLAAQKKTVQWEIPFVPFLTGGMILQMMAALMVGTGH